MKPDQVIKAVDLYEQVCKRHGIRPEEADKEARLLGSEKNLKHVMWMIPKVREMVQAGESAKAERWTRFIQGVVWCAGLFSIDEMQEHNRAPDPSETASCE